MAGWEPRGQPLVVACDPSRTKTNFYGTRTMKTGQEIVTEAATMNAAATTTHLRAILAAHPDVPVLLLRDRAPWHRGAEIQEMLDANPRLELILFPTAAPDLNPQEHVWKATRRAMSHNHTHRRLLDLAQRFEHHLTSTTFPSTFLDRYGWDLVCPMFV